MPAHSMDPNKDEEMIVLLEGLEQAVEVGTLGWLFHCHDGRARRNEDVVDSCVQST